MSAFIHTVPDWIHSNWATAESPSFLNLPHFVSLYVCLVFTQQDEGGDARKRGIKTEIQTLLNRQFIMMSLSEFELVSQRLMATDENWVKGERG